MRLWISFKPCVLTGFFWPRSARACGVLLCYRQVETDIPVPQQTSADTCLYCWAQGAQGFNFPRGLQSHDGGGGQLPSSGNDIWCPTRPALMTLAGSRRGRRPPYSLHRRTSRCPLGLYGHGWGESVLFMWCLAGVELYHLKCAGSLCPGSDWGLTCTWVFPGH